VQLVVSLGAMPTLGMYALALSQHIRNWFLALRNPRLDFSVSQTLDATMCGAMPISLWFGT
jgi:hypothetical protein